jgi:predicted dehydrogenase
MKKDLSTKATDLSRREFIKSTSVATLGMTAGGLSLVNCSPNDIIRVGLIGCGGRGTAAAIQAMNADKGVQVTALADIFEEKFTNSLNKMKESHPDQCRVEKKDCSLGFDGYKKVIDSGVDAVIIANVSKFHPEQFEFAVKAGKHAFVEKPSAMDPPGVKRVLAASGLAEEKGLSVVSGQMWRYAPQIQETIERIHNGEIGDIVAIQLTTHRDNFRFRERKENMSEIEFQLRNWTHFGWLSGDYMTASLVHHTDLALWAMHEELPSSVFGMGGRAAPYIDTHGDCFDHNAVIYEYENGVKVFAFLTVQPNCYVEVSDYVMGTKGTANLQKGWIKGENQWRYLGEEINPYQNEQDEFIKSIRTNKPINNGRYMALGTLTGMMAQVATYTGKKVTLDQIQDAGHILGGPGQVDFTTDPPVKMNKEGKYDVPIPGVTEIDLSPIV